MKTVESCKHEKRLTHKSQNLVLNHNERKPHNILRLEDPRKNIARATVMPNQMLNFFFYWLLGLYVPCER